MKRRVFARSGAAMLLCLAAFSMPLGCSSEVADTPAPVQTAEATQGGSGPSEAASPNPVAGEGQRDYRTRIKGGGEDSVTLMVYLCGSDLESEGGSATDDLIEMMSADISDNLNIVVETGGANEWANDVIDAETNQRWLLTSGDISLLDDVGARDMSSGETLQNFISYAAEAYPADRYMLVLWDHGGGTVDGYAYDERYEGGEMMSLAEMNQALDGAGVSFDMVGFDCCLMGTAETALMMEQYADYMVASQRVEPGNGWYYTPWVQALSQDTSIPTLELCSVIVDGFIEHNEDGYYGSELTLSVTDLTYIADLFDTMGDVFAQANDQLLVDNSFVSTSQALGRSRAMDKEHDLVDLAYLAGQMDNSEQLLQKLDNCVAYNGATIEDHSGLSLYFPYTDLGKVGDALDVYEEIGVDETYQDYITSFASLMVGGQAHSSGGTDNPLGGDGYDMDYWLAQDWVEQQLIDNEAFYEENNYDASELVIDEKGDGYVLSLSDEDWDMITAIEQRVFLDDGEGYIDLGADSMYEFDEDGDLMIDFDNTWVALDGELVCFYTTESISEGDEWYTYGIVPALYDEKDVEIILMWDDASPKGYAAGWRYTAAGSGSQKGLFEFADGMYFDIVCDYYTYDGEYEDQYLWGGFTVDGPVSVSYEDVGDADCMVYYELYDVYLNSYWTESVIYSMD